MDKTKVADFELRVCIGCRISDRWWDIRPLSPDRTGNIQWIRLQYFLLGKTELYRINLVFVVEYPVKLSLVLTWVNFHQLFKLLYFFEFIEKKIKAVEDIYVLIMFVYRRSIKFRRYSIIIFQDNLFFFFFFSSSFYTLNKGESKHVSIDQCFFKLNISVFIHFRDSLCFQSFLMCLINSVRNVKL